MWDLRCGHLNPRAFRSTTFALHSLNSTEAGQGSGLLFFERLRSWG